MERIIKKVKDLRIMIILINKKKEKVHTLSFLIDKEFLRKTLKGINLVLILLFTVRSSLNPPNPPIVSKNLPRI